MVLLKNISKITSQFDEFAWYRKTNLLSIKVFGAERGPDAEQFRIGLLAITNLPAKTPIHQRSSMPTPLKTSSSPWSTRHELQYFILSIDDMPATTILNATSAVGA